MLSRKFGQFLAENICYNIKIDKIGLAKKLGDLDKKYCRHMLQKVAKIRSLLSDWILSHKPESSKYSEKYL